MDARIRQRRIEVRRAGARRRRRMLGSVVLVLAIGAGGVGITRSPLFAITGVRVEGVSGAKADEVKATAQVQKGQNLMSADLGAALERTRDLPWVAAATVRRAPPSTVVIEVAPRKPVAVLAGVHGRWLVDHGGVVITEATDQRLPRIDLLTDGVPVPGTAIDDPAADNALALYAALPKDLRNALIAVEATGPRTMRVRVDLHRLNRPDGYAKGATTWVRMGTVGNVGEQVTVLRALLEQLRNGRQGVPSEIDIRVPSNPVVLP
jgi:cell division protein FtsQ